MIQQGIPCAPLTSDALEISPATLTNILENDDILYAKQRAINIEYTPAQSSAYEGLISTLKNDGNENSKNRLRLVQKIFDQTDFHAQPGNYK